MNYTILRGLCQKIRKKAKDERISAGYTRYMRNF